MSQQQSSLRCFPIEFGGKVKKKTKKKKKNRKYEKYNKHKHAHTHNFAKDINSPLEASAIQRQDAAKQCR